MNIELSKLLKPSTLTYEDYESLPVAKVILTWTTKRHIDDYWLTVHLADGDLRIPIQINHDDYAIIKGQQGWPQDRNPRYAEIKLHYIAIKGIRHKGSGAGDVRYHIDLFVDSKSYRRRFLDDRKVTVVRQRPWLDALFIDTCNVEGQANA